MSNIEKTSNKNTQPLSPEIPKPGVNTETVDKTNTVAKHLLVSEDDKKNSDKLNLGQRA